MSGSWRTSPPSEGQDCGICLCTIEQGEKARKFRCGCWLHLECAGRALTVKIQERRVDDEEMCTCPAACGRPLGRPIPPGVIRMSVGEEWFNRYLDIRMEVEWTKEAAEAGMLVAECPQCRFLVVCNQKDEMLSVKCLRPACKVDRFCAVCGNAPHRPLSCEEYQAAQEKKGAEQERIAELHMLADLGFQRCPRCGNASELREGCKWVKCNCGGRFCFHCGRDLPHARQHYHHWEKDEGPFGQACVGGRPDCNGELAVCMIMGKEVAPKTCTDCLGWSFGKTDCPRCKDWQFQSSEESVARQDDRSRPSRPRVGDMVELSEGYMEFVDATHGPLGPGDVGEIIQADHSRKPFQVKFEDRTWWYEEGALRMTFRGRGIERYLPVDGEETSNEDDDDESEEESDLSSDEDRR